MIDALLHEAKTGATAHNGFLPGVHSHFAWKKSWGKAGTRKPRSADDQNHGSRIQEEDGEWPEIGSKNGQPCRDECEM